MRQNTALRVTHLDKVFFGKRLLNNLSYSFKRGQSYALFGPSGIGKSTLLHILAGLEAPSAGTVTYQNTAVVFQAPHLIDELTVLENVMLSGLIVNNTSEKHAQKLLSDVDLLDKKDQQPRTLSGGEQQRVAVARALYQNPAFILADEPTAHLDRHCANQVIKLLISYQKEHTCGLIVATHDTRVTGMLDTTLAFIDGTITQEHVPSKMSVGAECHG